jgi:putative colanic acid biosynthesis glycosyltransferase WcaI
VRICFFNRSYYPDLSATGQLLTDLAEDLVRDYGCTVSVVAGPPLRGGRDSRRAKSTSPLRETHNGVEIFRAKGTAFDPRHFAGRAANYLSYFFSACRIGLQLPHQDIVVSLTDPPIIGLAALMTARRCGAQFVFVCQDVFPEVARVLEDFRSETVNRLLETVNRFLLRKAYLIVVPGEAMRARLITEKGADSGKVAIIHNWADCSAIVPLEKRNRFSVAHGLADAFVVMHSGNVGLSQNLDVLLDTAPRLRSYSDLVIVIVGDGAKRGMLEARVRSEQLTNIRFLPYQPKKQLAESFATADVFVVGLRRGLSGYIVPSKLYGILAAGRPYVAAVEESCEVAVTTRKFDCGILAEPDDADELAEAILTLYRDHELRRRLGANGRRAALNFDRARQVREYYDLLKRLRDERRSSTSPRRPLLKRPLDILLSGFGLAASAPLWVLIACAIRLEDRGPIFYSGYRVGKGGRRFRSGKFRTMIADSDRRFGPLQVRDGDARITRVGRLLRATAMDELPQLWNIFVGDMSFVGPRALVPEEAEVKGDGQVVPLERIPGYDLRQTVTPGLTGLAQVYAPRDIPRFQKFRLDALYIKRQSLWLDLKLVTLSVWITLRAKWEHRGKKI